MDNKTQKVSKFKINHQPHNCNNNLALIGRLLHKIQTNNINDRKQIHDNHSEKIAQEFKSRLQHCIQNIQKVKQI